MHIMTTIMAASAWRTFIQITYESERLAHLIASAHNCTVHFAPFIDSEAGKWGTCRVKEDSSISAAAAAATYDIPHRCVHIGDNVHLMDSIEHSILDRRTDFMCMAAHRCSTQRTANDSDSVCVHTANTAKFPN